MSNLLDKAASASPRANADKLNTVRDCARKMRDTQLEIADLEEKLSQANKRLQHLRFTELPDLFAEAGVTSVGLEAEGNMPAYEVQVRPYYYANIRADWPEEKREEAFQLLSDLGHESVIATEVAVRFDRGDYKKAMDLIGKLSGDLGLHPSLRQSVPWNTLTALLKSEFEAGRGGAIPLDKLGATVGREARLKKEKS